MRACVRASVRRRFGSIFYGKTGHRDNWPQATSDRDVRECVCPWPLDAEKSDGVACVCLFVTTGCREKWRKKDKTQDRALVDDRRMESFRRPISVRASVEVLKPSVRLSRSWNPVSVYRGPETQVLRANCNNAGLQARADCVRPSRVPTS